jgi:hypothetical protein
MFSSENTSITASHVLPKDADTSVAVRGPAGLGGSNGAHAASSEIPTMTRLIVVPDLSGDAGEPQLGRHPLLREV